MQAAGGEETIYIQLKALVCYLEIFLVPRLLGTILQSISLFYLNVCCCNMNFPQLINKILDFKYFIDQQSSNTTGSLLFSVKPVIYVRKTLIMRTSLTLNTITQVISDLKSEIRVYEQSVVT